MNSQLLEKTCGEYAINKYMYQAFLKAFKEEAHFELSPRDN